MVLPVGVTYSGSSGYGGVLNTYQTQYGNLQIIGSPTPAAAPVSSTPTAPTAMPVTPVYDPKIEASALYGKAQSLFAGGFARIGGSPSPLTGPIASRLGAGFADILVSLGLAVPVTGNRKIYTLYLDQEWAWRSVTGWDGSGALPGDSEWGPEIFEWSFRPGTLTQSITGLETELFPGDENAYRPQMLIEIRSLKTSRFIKNSNRPVPYVSADIGDVTDGADPYDGINLGTALERIAHSPWAGYSSSTFEAVDVTDVVPFILIKDNFTVVQLCQSVCRLYRNLNLLQSDKLRIKDHGSNVTPDIVLDRDTIVSGDAPIQISRADPSGQKRELELLKIDPDQDYTIVPSISKRPRDPFVISAAAGKETITVPIGMTADIGQAMVTFAQYYEENARKMISGQAMAYGYEMEPGDLVGIIPDVDGIDNEIYLVTETDHGANLVMSFQARAILRCSLFSVATNDDPYISYVVLLLGFEGADASTVITDESPALHGNATIIGNAQIDTAQFKFGSSSLLSDGSGDELSWPDSANWDLSDANGDQFTVECWGRLTTATPTSRALLWQGGTVGTLAFAFWIETTGQLAFWGSSDGAGHDWQVTASGMTWASATWYHLAASKDAYGKVRVFRDGVLVASSTPTTSVMANSGQTLRVGGDGSGGRSWPGWIDEVRITKGICRYPDDGGFTVPTAAFPRT